MAAAPAVARTVYRSSLQRRLLAHRPGGMQSVEFADKLKHWKVWLRQSSTSFYFSMTAFETLHFGQKGPDTLIVSMSMLPKSTTSQ